MPSSIGFENNGWFGAYCPRQRGAARPSTGTEVSVWTRPESRTRPGAALPRKVLRPFDSSALLFRATATGLIGIWNVPLRSTTISRRSLSRLSRSVAVTGAEDHGRLRPAPGGVGRVSPSRLRPGRRTARPRREVARQPEGPRRLCTLPASAWDQVWDQVAALHKTKPPDSRRFRMGRGGLEPPTYGL